MGCCLSRPAGPNAPYPDGAASASERAINAPSVGGRSSFVSGPVSASAPATGRATSASAAAAAAAAAPNGEGGNVNSDSDATIASVSSVAAAMRSQPRAQHAQPPAVPSSAPTATAASRAAAAALGGAPVSHPPSSSSHQPLPQLAQHINKPLSRPRRWTARNRMWSRQSIDRERVDFFDTRVTGRIEIWQTLRVVLELQWEAERAAAAAATAAAASGGLTADDHAEEEARATAQTILDAAAITLPTGDLTQGAYDVFGNFYALPAWIVSDPTNLLEREPGEDDDDESDDESDDGNADHDGDDEGEDSDPKTALGRQRRRSHHGDVANLDGSDTLSSSNGDRSSDDDDDGGDDDGDEGRTSHRRRRREEKGKAVLPAAAGAADTAAADAAGTPSRPRRRPVTVALRARLSLTGRDVVLRVGRDASVRSVAHQIAERAKLPPTARVRIAYMGRILKEGHSLSAQGWQEGHVVNALVFEVQPPSSDG